jgi:hypothetical protein
MLLAEPAIWNAMEKGIWKTERTIVDKIVAFYV